MDAIRCIGGPLHGKYTDDVGSYLRFEGVSEPLVEYVAPLWRPLRHGPGYRRLPAPIYTEFKPMKVERLTYIKRNIVVLSRVETVYVLEGLERFADKLQLSIPLGRGKDAQRRP